MTEEILLTKKDVMRYLQISSSTLARLMKKDLPYIKLEKSRRGKVLFKKSDLLNFIEAHKVQ